MNYQSNYEGPIGDMVDYYSLNDRADRLTYLIVASLVWPAKLYISLFFLALLIVLLITALPLILCRKGIERSSEVNSGIPTE